MLNFTPLRIKTCLLFLFVGALLSGILYHKYRLNSSHSRPPILIAHAAGAVNNRTYTNSLEAFEYNYGRGHRFFEADFSWTSDGYLVLIHDWTETLKGLFNFEGIPSLRQFKSLRMKYGMTQMSFEDLYSWLLTHQDAFIVTDIKAHNLAALKLIAAMTGKLKHQFIPQIYSLSEYAPARRLGFKDIILTLYRVNLPDEKIIEFTGKNRVFAITMPLERAVSTPLAADLRQKNIFVYAHTVNSIKVWKNITQKGVSGIYTDFLILNDVSQ